MKLEKTTSFEKSYNRLDQILEELNSNQVSLEQSIQLFEEANELIVQCEKKLCQAEQKIQILIKKRDGSLQTDECGEKKELFTPQSQQKSLSE